VRRWERFESSRFKAENAEGEGHGARRSGKQMGVGSEVNSWEARTPGGLEAWEAEREGHGIRCSAHGKN